MINLYLLCADLRNRQSDFSHKSHYIISEICSFLNNPSPKTAELTAGWKEDFRYIYGDINTNLSSNSKLNKRELLRQYHIEDVDEKREIESLQMLFFSIQTYFGLLTKYIMLNVLQGIRSGKRFSHKDIILGKFAEEYGIHNYCYEDWYCWPLFELDNGFGDIMCEICRNMEFYRDFTSMQDFLHNQNYDFIKQIYEAIIPKELRHALGEYYTPDWLAEAVLGSAISAYEKMCENVCEYFCEKQSVEKLSIVDPTCGSGTFLFKAIAYKRKNGCNLNSILTTISGMDINPLAVLTAKTNYLLSIIDLIDGETEINIPVYNADVISLAESMESIKDVDIVIGNPPWVNWEYLPEEYRNRSRHLWLDYGLFSAKGRELSFSKEDISVLITYIVMDKLLKNGGMIAFVIRQGVFKSAQNGVGFRKFQIRDEVPIKVLKVEDLSKIRVFENAATSTAVFYAQKGEKNQYPVPYYLWEKRADVRKCSFGAYSQLQEVMSQISVSEQCAVPAVSDDSTSLWLTAAKSDMGDMQRFLGTNEYRARTGVFTGGANAVYWLRINAASKDYVTVTNIVDRAKRKVEQITAEVESAYVYPMLRGSNVKKWNPTYDTYLLCPHTVETKMWPVPQKDLQATAPQTFDYLYHFKRELDGRNGFAGWEKEIQQQEFHAILRVGEYTFAKYKVVWKYIAQEFICAVISTVRDPYLGEKLLLPNEKIMYVSTDDESEAYYLCGILSSTPIAECVKSYMNPTGISAHVLNKLNIPRYDAENELHVEIARICREGHGKTDIIPYIKRMDELVSTLYKLK